MYENALVAGTPVAVYVAGPVGMPVRWAGTDLREAREYCERGRLSGKAREGYVIEAVALDGKVRTIALLRGYEGDWTAKDETLEAMGIRAMIGYAS